MGGQDPFPPLTPPWPLWLLPAAFLALPVLPWAGKKIPSTQGSGAGRGPAVHIWSGCLAGAAVPQDSLLSWGGAAVGEGSKRSLGPVWSAAGRSGGLVSQGRHRGCSLQSWAHREACEQEPSGPRPAQSPGRGQRFSMRNCWECFSTSRVLSCWLTPASHSRLRFAFSFLPRPCLHPSIELPEPAAPPWGPREAESVPSRHVSGPALPACSAPSQLKSLRPATLIEPCPGRSPQN